jgi:histidyl-tRNA synthetase
MGQERLVELMRLQAEPEADAPHVYLIMAGQGTLDKGLEIAERLRDSVRGLRIQANLAGGSFKAQFKRADRSGAELAVVLGENEIAEGRATVKPLRSEADQEQVALDQLSDWLNNWLQQAGRGVNRSC